jgi:hypothetical protein
MARSRNTIGRDNWSAAHAFLHHGPRALLAFGNVDKALSRRLARAQSASEALSSVPILFAWNTQNVVYEFLIFFALEMAIFQPRYLSIFPHLMWELTGGRDRSPRCTQRVEIPCHHDQDKHS